MANLDKIVKISAANYETLKNNGSVKINGTTYTYSTNNIYLTPDLLDLVYPIGSIYFSTSQSATPASLFGGTWVAISNKFLFAAGSLMSAGSYGGNWNACCVSHTHNVYGYTSLSGAHTHTVNGYTGLSGGFQMQSRTYEGGGIPTVMPYPSGSSGLIGITATGDSYYSLQGKQSASARVLSVSEHKHYVYGSTTSNGDHKHYVYGSCQYPSNSVAVSGRNMPPFLAVYVWKRTA